MLGKDGEDVFMIMGVVCVTAKVGEIMAADALEILPGKRVRDRYAYAGSHHGFVAGGIELVIEEGDVEVCISDMIFERCAGRVEAVRQREFY